MIRATSMVVYNAASKELTAKIVYYGPGYSGKTTNLQFLHRRLEPASVGNLLTLAATSDRTIFFDLLPVELGDLKGYRIRFQVATVPGQSPYNETRRVVLRGADGIVFVVDSRWSQLPKNLESFQNLKDNLKEEGIDPAAIPFAVQFNKRDLPDVLAIDALQEGLGLAGHPFIEAVSSEGKGVVETFKLISKLTFVDILRRLQKKGPGLRPARSASSESENLSAWKTWILHGTSSLHPEPAPAARPPAPSPPEPIAFPEPIGFPEPDDPMNETRAIPALRPAPPDDDTHPRSRGVSAEDSSPFSPTIPFPTAEEVPDAPPEPPDARRKDDVGALVFETFAPFPNVPPPLEDTDPAFFEKPAGLSPAPAPALPPARATTAAFGAPAVRDPVDPEITAPMAFPERVVPPRSTHSVESSRATSPPLPEPKSAAESAAEERMIQLAAAATWGDRLAALEDKVASLSAPEDPAARAELGRRLTAVEGSSAELETLRGRIDSAEEAANRRRDSFEARLASAESARGWEKDVNSLRTDWATARLAADAQSGELRKALTQLQQALAEGAGREMELVAQVSRGAREQAEALEKIKARQNDQDEQFRQLAADQESRLARLERLVDEHRSRSGAEGESFRRSIAGIEETVRGLAENSEERHRRSGEELETLRRAAEEDRARRGTSGEEMRRLLSEALAELAAKFRPEEPAS